MFSLRSLKTAFPHTPYHAMTPTKVQGNSLILSSCEMEYRPLVCSGQVSEIPINQFSANLCFGNMNQILDIRLAVDIPGMIGA